MVRQMLRYAYAIIIVQLGLIGAACSSDPGPLAATGGSGNDGGTTGGASNGGSVGAGGTTAQNSAGGMSNCPTWPREKVLPIIGPLFYGPNPGPCTRTFLGVTYTFAYDSAGLVSSQATPSATTDTYTRVQGLLTTEVVDLGQGATTTTYAYSANSITGTSTSRSGSQTQFVYTLNDQGYVTSYSLVGTPPVTNMPVRYEYVYSDCRLTERLAYLSNNNADPTSTTQYEYDAQGRLTARTTPSGTANEQYDYSCW